MANFTHNLNDHLSVIKSLEAQSPQLIQIAEKMSSLVKAGATVFWMGNGGSAADAQHLAAELIGRFTKERKTIPSLSLSTDTSVITCLSNDYDYSILFSRQLEGFCKAGDIIVGLTTSGNSANVLKGIAVGKKVGAYTVGLTGAAGDKLVAACDDCIKVPSMNTARIQEAHILIGHTWCEYIEDAIAAS